MLEKLEAKDFYVTCGLLCLTQLPKVIQSDESDSLVSRVMKLFGLKLPEIQHHEEEKNEVSSGSLGRFTSQFLMSCMAYSLLKPASLPAISQVSSKTIFPVGTLIVSLSLAMNLAHSAMHKPKESIELLEEEAKFPDIEFSTVVTHPYKRLFQPINPDQLQKKTSTSEPDLIRTSSPVKGLSTLCRVPTIPSFIDQRSVNQRI